MKRDEKVTIKKRLKLAQKYTKKLKKERKERKKVSKEKGK